MGPEQLLPGLINLGIPENSTIVFELHRIVAEIWRGGEVVQQLRRHHQDHAQEEGRDSAGYVALVAHAGKVPRKIVTHRLSDFREGKGILLDCDLLWTLLARCHVPLEITSVIRQLHHGIQAHVRIRDGE